MLEEISRLLCMMQVKSLSLLVSGAIHEPSISCAIEVRHSRVLFLA